MKKIFKPSLILLAIIFSSCAIQRNGAMQNIEKLEPGEGVVFGSVLIKNDLKNEKRSWGGLLGFLTEIDTSDFNYRLFVYKENFSIIPYLSLDLELNREKNFIYKLENGKYCMKELIPIQKGFPFADSLTIPVNSCFFVSNGAIYYIGKLFISIPEKIQTGSGVDLHVTDERDESIRVLEKNQEINLRASTTKLLLINHK
ncbi:hypothetical protein [Methylomonas methanica]|uniref:Lipoprotein n=1 Tax=Methylomonas methanica (strain DSM 25384 / MC09) TaxID=857087 RepID=G0A6G9_METMM|nr:hypothetical protein [Methylomonas methanica]AEF99270.1 hypothetical protein Metme_0831 [Methylomonas methanica MC09]